MFSWRTFSALCLLVFSACSSERSSLIDPGSVGPPGTVGGMDANVTSDGTVLDVDLDSVAFGDDTIDGGVAGDIVIDGVLSEALWETAAGFVQTTASTGTFFDGNSLARVRAMRLNSTLYIGIDATLIGSNIAIVALIDADYGSGNGVLYQGPLTDVAAQDFIDQILVRGFQVIDTGFRPDFAWATTAMPMARAVSAASIGVRNITTNPISRITSASISQCAANSCELALGINGSTSIAVALRLGNAQNLSNQTLPPDSPNNASAIAQVLVLR